MRKRVADFQSALPIVDIDLGSNARLPGDYMAGHAVGVTYRLEALPSEESLRADLQRIVQAYRALTFRGGIEGDVEPQAELEDEFKIPAQATVIETRKYAFHRKIERNRTAAKQAKKFHGTSCQACGLNFEQRYGTIGKGFIEAHHLRAIASLEEGGGGHVRCSGRLCGAVRQLPSHDPSHGGSEQFNFISGHASFNQAVNLQSFDRAGQLDSPNG
jgi:5-methylcytosine-specific restriction protein A